MQQEIAYGEALKCVAMGESYETTRGVMLDSFSALTPDEITDVLADAYRDALKQGVEREDIDDSWHRQ